MIAGLLRNLSSGLGLLALRKQEPDQFVRAFDQVVGLLLLNLLVWAGLDTLHAASGSQLTLDGLLDWACYLLLGLFGIALVARAESRVADTRALLVPVLSVAPFLLVLLRFAADLPWVADHPLVGTIVTLVYLLVLSVRVLRGAYAVVRIRTGAAAVALILLTPYVVGVLNLDTHLWVVVDTDDTDDSDDTATEPTLYDQPARIADAVDRVAATAEGAPAAYFIGFAGDGDQSIFKREALFAQDVFAQHFGSADRSIELINDVDDRDTYPLASVSGLQQTLKLLASRMDVDQDVLVMTLTSHGSQDGLEVTNGSIPLLQMSPADLRQALDEAGIKWRVIVVSACYSGVFQDALKSDTSLVITASDSDHSSFGCDDQRDLTYFGEAFLKDSVPTTSTLEAAFKKSVALVDQRETAEHKVHSNPQMTVGAQIRAKLAALEAAARQEEQDPQPH